MCDYFKLRIIDFWILTYTNPFVRSVTVEILKYNICISLDKRQTVQKKKHILFWVEIDYSINICKHVTLEFYCIFLCLVFAESFIAWEQIAVQLQTVIYFMVHFEGCE